MLFTMAEVLEVFSAHAEVVPVRLSHDRRQGGILRARGGSSALLNSTS